MGGAAGSRRSRAVAAVLFATVALAGCDPEPAAVEVDSPLRACPAGVSPSGPPVSGGPTVPDISLPCFTGGQPVALAALGRPAVINLWASGCEPCRTELPELQRFADASPRVVVLGVVTADRRSAAASLATDLGITFASVDDPDRRLLRALGRAALPVTLFVDESGVIRHEDVSGALSLTRLRDLAAEHLGER
jgi:cytochrome c biogenesis protein CcmG/thiol:disulfide interchange protein DsbE